MLTLRLLKSGILSLVVVHCLGEIHLSFSALTAA